MHQDDGSADLAELAPPDLALGSSECVVQCPTDGSLSGLCRRHSKIIRIAATDDQRRALGQLVPPAGQVGGLAGVARQFDGPVVRRA